MRFTSTRHACPGQASKNRVRERSGCSAESRHLKKRGKEARRSADAPLRRNWIQRLRAIAAMGEPEGEAQENFARTLFGSRHLLLNTPRIRTIIPGYVRLFSGHSIFRASFGKYQAMASKFSFC